MKISYEQQLINEWTKENKVKKIKTGVVTTNIDDYYKFNRVGSRAPQQNVLDAGFDKLGS